jgi:hypothetical protein
MVTPELNRPTSPGSSVRAVLGWTAALWAITIAATALGTFDPGLALHAAPHPTLRPTLGAGLSIFANNARSLAVPLLLVAVGCQNHPVGRCVGDLAIVTILALNGTLVGIELGRWQTQLLPYLPQLPLEWLAVGTATAAWTNSRHVTGEQSNRAAVTRAAAATAALLAAAAAVEVLLTPHAATAHR